MARAKTICIDFDGTIADYSKGWQGDDKFGEIFPGAAKAINTLKAMGWRVIIFTCREDNKALRDYLKEQGISFDEINGGQQQGSPKPVADVYIDDKGLRFQGDWMKSLEEILKFRPWWEGK